MMRMRLVFSLTSLPFRSHFAQMFLSKYVFSLCLCGWVRASRFTTGAQRCNEFAIQVHSYKNSDEPVLGVQVRHLIHMSIENDSGRDCGLNRRRIGTIWVLR